MRAALSLLWILLLGVPCAVLALSTRPRAAALPAPPGSDAGTYFFETVTQSTGDVVNGFITLHKDGTLAWSDQSDFGGSGYFNSTTQGTWSKTGPDEVTLVGYYYRFDAAGTPVVLVRITAVGSLASGQGVGEVDVYGPLQNPVLEEPWIAGADTIAIHTFPLD